MQNIFIFPKWGHQKGRNPSGLDLDRCCNREKAIFGRLREHKASLWPLQEEGLLDSL